MKENALNNELSNARKQKLNRTFVMTKEIKAACLLGYEHCSTLPKSALETFDSLLVLSNQSRHNERVWRCYNQSPVGFTTDPEDQAKPSGLCRELVRPLHL